MSLNILNFDIQGAPGGSIPNEWSHSGVVGSGDMETLLLKRKQNGLVKVRICTPVTGVDHVWKMVLNKFVTESGCGDLDIEINDNNATPFVVSLRLRQALAEARGGDIDEI